METEAYRGKERGTKVGREYICYHGPNRGKHCHMEAFSLHQLPEVGLTITPLHRGGN